MTSLTRASLAARIDHTLLKPEGSAAQVDQLCDEAIRYGIVAVCVNPVWAARCRAHFDRSKLPASRRPLVCSVAGFPLGAMTTRIKSEEARHAVAEGALEIDMVVNLADLLLGDSAAVTRDIAAVREAMRSENPEAILKVILETRALPDERIVLGCECCVKAGAEFVKTSTGFHAAGGATVEHVSLMKKSCGPLRVKAAGGIRDLAAAQAMLSAGADRLGMSASVAVLESLSV